MNKFTLQKLFIFTEIIMYFSFIIMDLNYMDSSFVKYSGILLCFIWSIYKKDKLLSISSFFTLLADYFLLLRNKNYIYGILSFIVVQLLYMHYLYINDCEMKIDLRIIIFITYFAIAYVNNLLTTFNVFVLFYFSMLLGNFLSSITNKNLKRISFGLFLFICCDICVGLFNVLPSGSLTHYISILIWIFYLPSQVLIYY